MREIIETIMESYGTTVTMVGESGSESFRAFLQLVTSKSWQNMQSVFGPLGEIPQGQYLYMGPVDKDVGNADHLCCCGTDYLVRRADTLMIGNEPAYIWGLCVRKGADDPWSS